METRTKLLFSGALICTAVGCAIKTNQVAIGQKTSLEKQLMGELQPLSEEEILVSSVRAGEGVAIGSRDDLQSRALTARQRQLFNRDDLDEMKKGGCVGEATGARLVARDCSRLSNPAFRALREKIIEQENADRQAILDWAIDVDPVLTSNDRPEITEIYHQLLIERAHPGEWVELNGGRWIQR